MSNEFVSYLNTLHNYNAQNPNSYGEKNVANNFFRDVMVEVGLSKYIRDNIQQNEAHAIILTGHAGDGKTSIMYQVLSDFRIVFDPNKKITDYVLPAGKKCRCIKDFSEIPDEEKAQVLGEALDMPKCGDFVFMVANTGPLINTFGSLFETSDKAEEAKIKLIEAMDSNTGKILDICGYKICVINVAAVDNTYFATEFLNNIIKDNLWSGCATCSKNMYCHIWKNKELIRKNKSRVFEFLNMHYVWITEHGKRLTIRSMTEQLAFMLTGGINCDEVKNIDSYQLLFPNLFFGFVGTMINPRALNILAVRIANECNYDNKRMRIDEQILVNNDYSHVFGKEVAEIVEAAQYKNAYVSGWAEMIRRFFFFTNIFTDSLVMDQVYEDIFSKQYCRYLSLRNGTTTPSRTDANLVCDALSMIYVGTTNNDSIIPITLSRESGITQNVQLITGEIYTKNIKIVQRETKDSLFNEGQKRYSLRLDVNRNELNSEITLPLLNFFEELKNGIISTNVDPQLSHGIESLKAELSELMSDDDDDTFDMIILRNNGAKPVSLEITENGYIREQ